MKIVSFPFIDIADTPIGSVLIKATQDHIREVGFIEQDDVLSMKISSSPLTESCRQQLSEYFEGKRSRFELPLQQEGTAFQQKIWELLDQLGYGESISYLQLARMSGDEKNIRAVANANARNKIALLVPCHRVIGAGGKLTGYAWGLKRKQFLLDLEARSSGKKLSLF
jgi:methylated-DNA-[protein]-cysteine S-methyltransferase